MYSAPVKSRGLEVTKTAGGFSVSFDIHRLEEFKSYFYKCKFNPINKSWEVPVEQEADLRSWAEKYPFVSGKLMAEREEKITAYRAKLALVKKEAEDLRAKTDHAIAQAKADEEAKNEAVRVIVNAISSKSLVARYAQNDTATQAAFEILGDDLLTKSVQTLLSGEEKAMQPAKRTNIRATFTIVNCAEKLASAKATIADAHKKLADIGFTTAALTNLLNHGAEAKFDPEKWTMLEPVQAGA